MKKPKMYKIKDKKCYYTISRKIPSIHYCCLCVVKWNENEIIYLWFHFNLHEVSYFHFNRKNTHLFKFLNWWHSVHFMELPHLIHQRRVAQREGRALTEMLEIFLCRLAWNWNRGRGEVFGMLPSPPPEKTKYFLIPLNPFDMFVRWMNYWVYVLN